MNKKDIIEFFDACAPSWDADMIKNDEIINHILDSARIACGTRVLDVACGTGVVFDYYLSRGAQITGIDISPEMVRIARQKYPSLDIICGDAEEIIFDTPFDSAVVYNAFPHFPDPRKTVSALARLLKPGGCLTVAHGMSRDMINRHHSGAASKVSRGLMPASELAQIFQAHFTVDTVIDASDRYIVSGVCKKA